MPIDTLKASKRLQEDETFTAEQAERIAEILSDLDVASATKEDLNDLEGRLTERIDGLEQRIDGLETRMDERFQHAAEERASIEQRLTQRIELSEGRLSKQIEQNRTYVVRVVVASVAAVGAILAVVIPLAIYAVN